jgi:hypothetical protein
MPPRKDFIENQRKQIANRLEELRPAHEEYLTLLDAQQALDSLKAPTSRGTSGGATRAGRGRVSRRPAPDGRRRGPGRPPGRGVARRRVARRRGANTRAEQALRLISSNPGITVAEIARRLGMRQNYLYRVMAQLQKEGKVRRRQRGYHSS